jgi:hypothetical protein
MVKFILRSSKTIPKRQKCIFIGNFVSYAQQMIFFSSFVRQKRKMRRYLVISQAN